MTKPVSALTFTRITSGAQPGSVMAKPLLIGLDFGIGSRWIGPTSKSFRTKPQSLHAGRIQGQVRPSLHASSSGGLASIGSAVLLCATHQKHIAIATPASHSQSDSVTINISTTLRSRHHADTVHECFLPACSRCAPIDRKGSIKNERYPSMEAFKRETIPAQFD